MKKNHFPFTVTDDERITELMSIVDAFSRDFEELGVADKLNHIGQMREVLNELEHIISK